MSAAEYKHVDGKDDKKIVLYALSTCGWCRKTKKLLGSIGLAYDYIDVDLLDEKTSDEVDNEMRKWNPKGTYPTIVIDKKETIAGFDDEKIKELAA